MTADENMATNASEMSTVRLFKAGLRRSFENATSPKPRTFKVPLEYTRSLEGLKASLRVKIGVDDSLDKIHIDVRECRLCRLSKNRVNAVPGEGPVDAKAILIGEAPGRREDIGGRPFIGPAGRVFDEALKATGIRRDQLYITSVVKCRPPFNRQPRADEVAACRTYLERQIKLIRPRVIGLLGGVALNSFFKGVKVSEAHGKPMVVGGVTYLPLYHPAAVLQGRPRLREAVVRDMEVLKRLITVC